MKTAAASLEHSSGNFFTRSIANWDRFWFKPADPTLLGLLRLCCGVVLIYVFAGYGFDLKEFFGPDAWIDRQAIDEFRFDYPWINRSGDWNDYSPPSEPTNDREKAFVEKWQVHPKQAYAQGAPLWSVWFSISDPRQMKIVQGLMMGTAFLFTIGFCTRITSVLVWLSALSYLQRSPTTVFGMDAIMSLLLLYLMIGPSGACLSVDRLISRYMAARRTLSSRSKREGGEGLATLAQVKPEPRVSANLALRLVQIHICFVYMASGLSKLQGNSWWSMTALWGTLINPEFSPVHVHSYIVILTFFCKHRWLWEVVMSGGVMFTLIFEIGFPSLIWNRRTRLVVIVAALLLHSGIALFMGLTTFSLMMMVSVLSFLPPETLDRFLQFLGKGVTRWHLSFQGANEKQCRTASLVYAVDAWNQIDWLNSQSLPRIRETGGTPLPQNTLRRPGQAAVYAADSQTMQLLSATGESYTGYAMFERLVRSLRLLWPVGVLSWIPCAGSLGRSFVQNSQTSARTTEEKEVRTREIA